MKTILISILVSLAAHAAVAQYTIDWFNISAGGGVSTGGVYSVSGTIGQTATGTLTGGQYGLVGGFWSFIATVPSLGSPTLTITVTAANAVMVCWPSPGTGFVLEQNPDPGTTNWTTVPQTPMDNGTTRYITVRPPVGNVFYRLRRP